MMMQMITDEQAMDIILEEKYKIGKNEGILSIVTFMNRNGLNVQEISKNTGLSEAEVENLLLSDRK